MDLKIIFFALMILLAFIAPHFLLYITIRNCFSLTSKKSRTTILIIISCLSISFFLSAMLSRFFDTWLTRLFNYLAQLWQGYFLYLIIAALVIWSVIGLARLLKFTINRRLLAGILLSLAIIYSTYGYIHAMHLIVKPLTVKLLNLPQQWQGKKIIHLTDVHLGSINSLGFLKKLITKIDTIGPDLILITGDLFDGMNGNVNRFIPLLTRLKAKKGVYFVTGNHEGYLGLTEPLKAIKQTAIKHLDNEIITIEGLQLIGINFPEYNSPVNIRQIFAANGPYDKDKPGILLYHTPTNIVTAHETRGDQQFNTYWSPDATFNFAKQVGIDLQLSGHTHAGQLWPFGFITKMIFGKYHYGLHTEGSFNIYTSSGTATWGPPMRTGCDSELTIITLE